MVAVSMQGELGQYEIRNIGRRAGEGGGVGEK